jgi:Nematode polyprotein allergen ABA-1
VDDDTATSDAEAQDSQDEFDTDHHYGWLNGDQKRQLRDHRTQGGSVHQKMLEFFDVSPDDVKSMARSLLSSGCEKLMSKIFGEEKAEEMKQMRSQGADAQEVRTKMQEFANEIEDEGERGEALQHGSICQKIFEATAVRRRRAPPLNAHLQQGRGVQHTIFCLVIHSS